MSGLRCAAHMFRKSSHAVKPMLLAIDAGNTNVVFALFADDKIVGRWRITTVAARTADEYAVFLHTMMQAAGFGAKDIQHAILGSVVPEANFHLISLCRDHFKCEPKVVGAPGVNPGIKIDMDRPDEVGADRIINAVGGLELYKPSFMIVDFGTATTFDVINAQGDYIGGAIAPGINLSLQALHMAAAKLPRIGVAKPKAIIGKNTVDAVQSGIFWGYVGLIEGMIARIKQELGSSVTVVATGGLATLFRDAVSVIDHYDDDITLRGLRLIHQRNQ